jgi:hypothetical protein
MKIENLRTEKNKGRKRVAATVIWEDCGRPSYELYFETDEIFSESLSCNPHAFLLACSIPAQHYAEKRVHIDEKVCPEFRDGLMVAMGWLSHWYGGERPRIETKGQLLTFTERHKKRAGFLFSGGIDSFMTLRRNRLNFPMDHPLSIKDGLLIFGLEQDIPEKFEYFKDFLAMAARDLDITLIPAYTNLYLPFRQEDEKNNWDLWQHKFMGAALAATAHAFSRRFGEVSISPDYDIPNYHPNGSHPLLEPNYSSVDLRIRYDGTDLSRFERTKLIVDWGLPLPYLRVCNMYKLYQPDKFNCGKCEKCVRTMLALLALDALGKSKAFPRDDVSEEMLSNISITRQPFYYKELIGPLKQCGREDLALILGKKMRMTVTPLGILQSRIKKLDKRYLNGGLGKLASLVSKGKL